MVIKGKPIGIYESIRSTEGRTWINIKFFQDPKDPKQFFLYDVESDKEPIPIGWFHVEDFKYMGLIPGMFDDLEDGQVREIRLTYLRVATKYHPMLNRNPWGYNKEDGSKSIHSRPAIPYR